MASIITSRTLAIARRRPQWPICLNRDDSRAKGLRSWYPLFPNIKGKNLIRPGEWELEAQSATTWETDAEMGYVARTSGTDNSNYEAQHATSPAEGADDLTIACWYYPIAHEDDYGIIVGRSLYLHPFLLQVYGSSIEGVRFGLRTTTSRYVIASDSVTVGKWQRLVCTYDHNYVRLYVNGVECGTPVADTEDIEISANRLHNNLPGFLKRSINPFWIFATGCGEEGLAASAALDPGGDFANHHRGIELEVLDQLVGQHNGQVCLSTDLGTQDEAELLMPGTHPERQVAQL